MLTVDKTKLNIAHRDAEYVGKLEEFAEQFTKARPMCDFFVDDDCMMTMYKDVDGTRVGVKYIRRLKVTSAGEMLGHIGISDRYRNGSTESVYEVSSFRIRKERGNENATQAKDLKVALRVAKKTLVSRVDDELKELIGKKVRDNVYAMHNGARNEMRWEFKVDDEIIFMAMLGYEARLKSEPTISMPSTAFTLTGKDMKKHDTKCERYKTWTDLQLALDAKQGYGLMLRNDNSITMYSLAQDSITHYKHYGELPTSVQEKFAMFKVLEINEGYSHIGCKFVDSMFFIAP